MKLVDILNRSGRSLRTAKTRTILTSLAIAVGAFTLTLTLAAGNGIRAYTDRLVADNFDPTESIVGRDKEIENNGPFNMAPKEYDESVGSIRAGATGGSLQLKQITDQDVAELSKLPIVEQVRPDY
jgi:putative ABC transport system permease protein